MDTPYTVEKYAKGDTTCLDAQRFCHMPQSEYISLRNVQDVNRLTAKGGWTKLCNHWGSRGVLSSNVPRKALDMTFIRMSEEAV